MLSLSTKQPSWPQTTDVPGKSGAYVLKSCGVFKGADEMLQTFYHLLVSPRNIITCPSMPTVLWKAGERTDATWRGQAGSTAIVTASRPCWHLVFGALSFVGRRRRQRHKIFTKQSCFTMLESSYKRSSSQNKGWQINILNPSKKQKKCLLSEGRTTAHFLWIKVWAFYFLFKEYTLKPICKMSRTAVVSVSRWITFTGWQMNHTLDNDCTSVL